MTDTGRFLSSAEIDALNAGGFEIGFDDDDENKEQLRHICWPYTLHWGAVCGAPRLWFHGGPLANGGPSSGHVSCGACLLRIPELMRMDPVLLAAVQRLSQHAHALTQWLGRATNLLMVLEDPSLLRKPEDLDDLRSRWKEAALAQDDYYKSKTTPPLGAFGEGREDMQRAVAFHALRGDR